MSKHTPGPWEIGTQIPFGGDQGRWFGGCTRVFAPDQPDGAQNSVAVVPNPANARLIAEAPAMLEALKMSLALLTEHGERTGNYAGCADIRAILDRVGEGE